MTSTPGSLLTSGEGRGLQVLLALLEALERQAVALGELGKLDAARLGQVEALIGVQNPMTIDKEPLGAQMSSPGRTLTECLRREYTGTRVQ